MLKDLFFPNGAALAADVGVGRDDCTAAFAVSLVHHLPGRLRLRSAALKGDPRAGENARKRLADLPGTCSVAVNLETGSLLLEYDPVVIAPDRIAERLAARGFGVSTDAAGGEIEPSLIGQLVSAVKGWAIDALAEHLVLAIIGAVA